MPSRRTNPMLAALTLCAAVLAVGLALLALHAVAAVALGALAAGIGAYLIAGRSGKAPTSGPDSALRRLDAITTARGIPPRERGVSEGVPPGTLGIADRVEELAVRFDLYRGVFQALGSAAIVFDRSGRVIIANPAAGRLLDSEPASLIGLEPHALFTEADVLALYESAARGEVSNRRVRIVRGGLTGIYEGIAVPIEVSGEGGVILLLRDITELAQASELKTDFVGNASHELRTPIAAIRAAVDTLIGPARDDGPMRDRLATMIRDHVLRLEELVRDLLDLSRFEAPDDAGVISHVDCATLSAEIEAMLGPLRADRGVTLSFDFDPGLRGLRTNAQALTLILRNLIDNAIKFSHPGGQVRVVGTLTGDAMACIRVIDRGVGIPIAQQSRIFERFYQVDQARSGALPKRGTGLGLAIVKHALRRIGGSIEVESVWNEGTTMTVFFPLDARSKDPRSEPRHPPAVA